MNAADSYEQRFGLNVDPRELAALRDLAEAVRVFLETPGASTFALEQMMRKVEEVRR